MAEPLIHPCQERTITVNDQGRPHQDTRVEEDGLGPVEIPITALWGPSTQRAHDNFDITRRPVASMRSLIWALGAVKYAAAQANKELGLIGKDVAGAIQRAAKEVMDGVHDDHFVIDRLQGGAGTSTNMNANEVIANRATSLLGNSHSGATRVDPLDEVNRSQSTNDVYPTALKLALIKDIRALQAQVTKLSDAFAAKAEEFSRIVKIGRTQLQDAVPMTLGQEFGAFAESMRDEVQQLRRSTESLVENNLGGTAIGTGITAPAQYPPAVNETLKKITGIDVKNADDLVYATSDAAPFLKASAALRSLAVRLSKISNDLRLLSSGPQAGLGEIKLPPVQPGSSIMPGKVNPVIPEVITQVSYRVIGNDVANVMAVEAGQLQLNAFLPLVADGLVDSIALLTNAVRTLRTKCVEGITANEALLKQRVHESVSIVTALTPLIGYTAGAELGKDALNKGLSIVDGVLERGLATQEQIDHALSIRELTGAAQPDTGQ